MRIISEASRETKLLVAFFEKLPVGAEISYESATESVGFQVIGSPSYYSARKIAKREHAIVIDGIRGFGFRRLDGASIVGALGDRRLRSIRTTARKGAREMVIAFDTSSLDKQLSQEGSEKLTRFRLMGVTARPVKTDRRRTEQPPEVEKTDSAKILALVA